MSGLGPIAVHLRGWVNRQLVAEHGGRQQPRRLLGREHLGRAAAGGAVGPPPRPPGAVQASAVRWARGKPARERLPGEEGPADERRRLSTPGLAGRLADPRGVGDESPVLGVSANAPDQPGSVGCARSTVGAMWSGMTTLK